MARKCGGAINFDEAVIKRERETEWMFKPRTVYPHDLREKVDICEDGKKDSNSDDENDGRLFHSFPRIFQKD